ncbi:MAG: octaprenyl diphosphate synthase, partial [Methylophilaceae bacterium]
EAIEHGGLEDMSAVLAAVSATNASEYVLNLARQESKYACSTIAHFPDSNYKTALIQLAEFSVARQY